MKFAVRGLKRADRRKRIKMGCETIMDNALKNLGNKVKVGNRAVT